MRPFTSRHFGAAYPYGNKIEGWRSCRRANLRLLRQRYADHGALGPDRLSVCAACGLDAARGDLARPRPGWPGHAAVWGSLYAQAGLDFDASQDPDFGPDDWRRYLYFNAGWFFGADPAAFGARFLATALMIRDRTPRRLTASPCTPGWIRWPCRADDPCDGRRAAGAGPCRLDGAVTCHWRTFHTPLCARKRSGGGGAGKGRGPAAGGPSPRPLGALRAHGPCPRRPAKRGACLTAPTCKGTKSIRKLLKDEGLWLR